jgi:hypothetical protein
MDGTGNLFDKETRKGRTAEDYLKASRASPDPPNALIVTQDEHHNLNSQIAKTVIHPKPIVMANVTKGGVGEVPNRDWEINEARYGKEEDDVDSISSFSTTSTLMEPVDMEQSQAGESNYAAHKRKNEALTRDQIKLSNRNQVIVETNIRHLQVLYCLLQFGCCVSELFSPQYTCNAIILNTVLVNVESECTKSLYRS